MKLKTKTKIKRSKRVIFKEINGVVYILDPRNATVYTLNETASFIWQSLKIPRSSEELISLITKNFNIERKKSEKDSENFITQCFNNKLFVK